MERRQLGRESVVLCHLASRGVKMAHGRRGDEKFAKLEEEAEEVSNARVKELLLRRKSGATCLCPAHLNPTLPRGGGSRRQQCIGSFQDGVEKKSDISKKL